MSTHYDRKINSLIRDWPKGTVGTQAWLNSRGINRFLAQRYCLSSWIERIGRGAYRLAGDNPDWMGAVYALQSQLKYKIHVGAQTALELQGYRQYVPQSKGQPIWLLKSVAENRHLPKWFSENFTEPYNIHCITKALFDDGAVGLDSLDVTNFQLHVSTPERAILEYLSLVPNYFSLEQAQFIIEGMMTLRPKLLQSLLERCTSIKAKRLFLLLAENERHPWWYKLDLGKIELGTNKFAIAQGGYYYSAYQISLPIKLNIYEEDQNDDEESLP